MSNSGCKFTKINEKVNNSWFIKKINSVQRNWRTFFLKPWTKLIIIRQKTARDKVEVNQFWINRSSYYRKCFYQNFRKCKRKNNATWMVNLLTTRDERPCPGAISVFELKCYCVRDTFRFAFPPPILQIRTK